MSDAKKPLIQAEFFHVGGPNTKSLEELLEECRKRTADVLLPQDDIGHSRIKTVIRFFDESEELTKLVLRAAELQKRRIDLIGTTGTNLLRCWLLSKEYRRLLAQWSSMVEQIQKRAVQCADNALTSSRAVAIERLNHSFRLIRPDEAHEVSEKIRNSKDVWLFVFEPNELLSEANTPIGSYM